METTPIRKRETELNPRRGSARLRANRFAPLQTVDRPKPGKFTRSRRPAGRVRAHARPSFALLDRAFPGPRTKREGRALLTENWQHWNWQPFHIGNMGRVLPVCECCQSPVPIANAPYLPAALRGRAAPAIRPSTNRRHRRHRRTFAGSRTNRQRACVRAAAFFLPSAPSPFGLSCAVRRHRRRRRCRRPAALRGGPPPQSGQGRQDDATTRRQDRPRPPSERGGRFPVAPSARRPVVLAKRVSHHPFKP